MSLKTKSDVLFLPSNESPKKDSLAANRLTSGQSAHKMCTKQDSRKCGKPLTNGKHEQFANLIAQGGESRRSLPYVWI